MNTLKKDGLLRQIRTSARAAQLHQTHIEMKKEKDSIIRSKVTRCFSDKTFNGFWSCLK